MACEGWPNKFNVLEPGYRLYWLFEGRWRVVHVTKFDRRGPLYFEVAAGNPRKQYPRFAMPEEAQNFWIPYDSGSQWQRGGPQDSKADSKNAVKKALHPKVGFLNMLNPRHKKLYDTAAQRGRVELCLRRSGLPDRRMLMKKTSVIYKLRHSYSVCIGYPKEKLTLINRHRVLVDTDTPESLSLEDNEVIDIQLEPL